MANSENKTIHVQYKISYINTNVTVIGITHWIIIYMIIDFIDSHCQMAKGSTKHKFELNRSDHNSYANRA